MSIILTHLGDSIPLYIHDCVKQIRLWNFSTPIYIILNTVQNNIDFWNNLVKNYSVILVLTNSLAPTQHHTFFNNNFQGDTQFRKGYWKHVKERFYFIEELMIRDNLIDVISMEYDVLLYVDFTTLINKCKTSSQTLRMVRDNDLRGHPAFLYIPNYNMISHFNMFLTSIVNTKLEDMQSLAAYANTYSDKINYFPVITEMRRKSILHRKSLSGHESVDSSYLSQDSEHFLCLFDSLVVGQWVGGIDSRNTGGQKIVNYENESALYNIKEMNLVWKKCEDNFLWQPILDGRPLATIHMHSKALGSFMSDRSNYPTCDYNVHTIFKNLLPN